VAGSDKSGGPAAEWYIRKVDASDGYHLWKVTKDLAIRMNVTNPETGLGTYFVADPGETIWDAIERNSGWKQGDGPDDFTRMELGPGKFYPRMARELPRMSSPALWYPNWKAERSHMASVTNQLILLTRQLEAVCRVVQPSPETMDVHGHEIRNLLILAATEAEMHWRGVLVANGNLKKAYTTKDYVKVAEPLRLSEYRVVFQRYPDIEALAPFANWDKSNPTGLLPWYSAYNAVKHDRENQFDQASLRHAFDALAACVALSIAQFSRQILTFELSAFFRVTDPTWTLSSKLIHPVDGSDWKPVFHSALA
jgi:hypothetical protein